MHFYMLRKSPTKFGTHKLLSRVSSGDPCILMCSKDCVLAGIKRSSDSVSHYHTESCIYFEYSGIICRESEAAGLIWCTPNKKNNTKNSS